MTNDSTGEEEPDRVSSRLLPLVLLACVVLVLGAIAFGGRALVRTVAPQLAVDARYACDAPTGIPMSPEAEERMWPIKAP